MQQLMIAAAVLAVLGGSMWLLHRYGLARFSGLSVHRAPRKLEVIERLQLTPQHSLCLIRIDDRTLLISTAPSSCRVLTVTDQA